MSTFVGHRDAHDDGRRSVRFVLRRPGQIGRGFTLVELLVVIAIIGVLVGLLLPAVQAAREAARRSSCQNNLKQVAMALLLHHDARNVFPLGSGRLGLSTSAPQSGTLAWSARVLPYMERSDLFDRFPEDVAKGQTAVPDSPTGDQLALVQTPVNTFRCPSAIGGPLNLNFNSFATNNYPASFAICQNNFSVGIRDITDGTSRTLLLAEKFYSNAATLPWKSLGGNWPTMRKGTVASYGFEAKARPNTPYAGTMGAGCCGGDTDPIVTRTQATSLHAGGIQVAMCDGSTRFLEEGIEANPSLTTNGGNFLWQNLFLINDGNTSAR